MLKQIHHLVESLNAQGIRYCHWKSNRALAESLAGETDVDLLIGRRDANRFRQTLAQLDFRPAINLDNKRFPSVEHYFAQDAATANFVHVHAYYQVITGQSLTKNYHLPLEAMLLDNTCDMAGMPVPTKAAELVIFTLRLLLKHTALTELLLLARHWKEVEQEAAWLISAETAAEAQALAHCWLPALDSDFLAACIAALAEPAPLWRRIQLAFQLRGRLRSFTRLPAWRIWLQGNMRFLSMVLGRILPTSTGKMLQSGGMVIAFVGSEATGKSTLLAMTNKWLSEHFSVEQIHVGKPQTTAVGLLPKLLLPLLRRLLPKARSTKVLLAQADTPTSRPTKPMPLIFALRSVLLAYDRRAQIRRAYRRAANGRIMLCDRYPTQVAGAPDSAQLGHFPPEALNTRLRRWLAAAEASLYRDMPPPDLVIYLRAPLEVTLQRNASRGKFEPEDYVRRRHMESSNLKFGSAPVCHIDTNQPFEETILAVKSAVWRAL